MTGYKRVSEMTLEEKREKVAGFNVMDDVFFQKMMEDKEVCEEILRINAKVKDQTSVSELMEYFTDSNG